MVDNSRRFDFLVAGGGLSGLVFAALAAKEGASVCLVEAHEYAGGYGHTFQMGKSAKFNAQLHYVWNCGEGETVNLVLKDLGLVDTVTFEKLCVDGFDHMRLPDASIKIPSDADELVKRLTSVSPEAEPAIRKFVALVNRVAHGVDFVTSEKSLKRVLVDGGAALTTARWQGSTLQDVFDHCRLPQVTQSLLASQWPDFLLPPERLSFIAWVMLFTGYQRGAYYPTHHFEHVIDSLVSVIKQNDGEVRLSQQVTNFLVDDDRVTGLKIKDLIVQETYALYAEQVVSNIDPATTARMVGVERFSSRIQGRLDYEYSPSNFMIYSTVEGIDLRDHGFGPWNTFHSDLTDINAVFRRMYDDHDYSQPSFAITTPGLMTEDESDRPPGQQIMEFLTVADYDYFDNLLRTDRKQYLAKKREIVDAIFDIVERDYIPGFRQYINFKISGSPTTNERFCRAPRGNSYGSNMTPGNIGLGRLGHESSVPGLYFCNASAGYPGFAGAFWNGRSLALKLLNSPTR